MRIYPVFLSHAGCPHRCVYCRQQMTVSGEPPPTPAAVAELLEGWLPQAGGGEVAFYGGTFTLLPEALQNAYLAVVAGFRRAGRVAGVRVSTRPDAVCVESAARLAAGGVTTVELGCQSFDAGVLARSGRGHGPEAGAEAVTALRQAGLSVGLQLMPGLPGGDREEALASLESALALRPDLIRLYPAVVPCGTLLADWFRRGVYQPLSLDEAVDWCADLLWRCRQAGVAVARIGLQSTPGLDDGTALVAGPYHPAFGQLVRSRLWLRALLRGAGLTGGRQAVVAPADLADALGHRRRNLDALRRRFADFSIVSRPHLARESLLLGDAQFTLQELSAHH
jgi:histone acetyltransferase (RNA polymerase elongator complex component)